MSTATIPIRDVSDDQPVDLLADQIRTDYSAYLALIEGPGRQTPAPTNGHSSAARPQEGSR